MNRRDEGPALGGQADPGGVLAHIVDCAIDLHLVVEVAEPAALNPGREHASRVSMIITQRVDSLAIELAGSRLQICNDVLDQPFGVTVDYEVNMIGHDGACEGAYANLRKDRREPAPDGASLDPIVGLVREGASLVGLGCLSERSQVRRPDFVRPRTPGIVGQPESVTGPDRVVPLDHGAILLNATVHQQHLPPRLAPAPTPGLRNRGRRPGVGTGAKRGAPRCSNGGGPRIRPRPAQRSGGQSASHCRVRTSRKELPC